MSQAPCSLNPFATSSAFFATFAVREIHLTAKVAKKAQRAQRLSKFLQLALQEREVFLDLLAQILAVEPHRRVIADDEATPVALDDATARLVHTLQAEHRLRRHAAQKHHERRVYQFHLLK